MKVINVQGRKKTGKTTTVTNIIAELVRRGYSVGSVKGIHIDGFTFDVEGEDTGKHKAAGANPVTARCHDETNIMFTQRMDLAEILRHYETDWVVIESHVDLHCPNIVTGRTAYYDGEGKDVSLEEQVNELTIGCSGVIAGELAEFEGLPVINAMTDTGKLVDLIEEKTYDYKPAAEDAPVADSAKALDTEEKEFSLIESNDYIRISADGSKTSGTDSMLTENSIDIMLNGFYAGTVPCTPQYMQELVLGWLLYEGYIGGMEDIVSVTISAGGTAAQVMLREGVLQRSADGTIRRLPVKRVSPVPWKKEWIFHLAEDFEHNMPLREQTMAAHNCRLAVGDVDGNIQILFKCEDIGRHSAIDKVIGWGLENGIDMKKCVLFTSGRISLAMAKKVVRAGIPVMAGKGTISKRAVQLAEANDLTLIGYSGKDSICLFAGKEPEEQ